MHVIKIKMQTKRMHPKLRSDYLWWRREVNGIKEEARGLLML